MSRLDELKAEKARRMANSEQPVAATSSQVAAPNSSLEALYAERDKRNAKKLAEKPVIPEQPKEVDFDAGTMIKNIPGSALETVRDIYNAFRHPIDTALAINKVGTGAIHKLTPGTQNSEKYADAVGEFVTNRYGSVDALKKTLMDDPVGLLGDFAGALSAGSMAVPKYGSKMAKVAGAIDPANLAVSGGTKLIANTPGIRNIPSSMYQGAAKFPKKFDSNQLADIALREKILPTDAGIEKAKSAISGIDQQITDLIQKSVDTGERIPRRALYKHLKEVKQDLGGVNLDAAENIKKINKVVSSFEEYIKGRGKDNLTAAEVQSFKQKIYKSINWKAKQGTGSMAKADTKKAIARGAKEELENIIPDIKGFNLRQGELLELLDGIDAPAQRISNRDMIGIGMPIKVGTGVAAGGELGGFAGFLLGLADSPTAKANLAIGLDAIKKQSISDARKRVLVLELLKNAGKAGQEEAFTE